MPGICTSAMTHDVPSKRPDRKKSSADENAWTVYPCRPQKLAGRRANRRIVVDDGNNWNPLTRPAFLTREPALAQHDRSVEKCAAESTLWNHT